MKRDSVLSRETVWNAVQRHLIGFGWTGNDGTALARKSYQTAVGNKEALAYLADYGKNSDNFILTGEYWSEGRNCLSTVLVAVPKSAAPETIPELVMEFALKTDEAVAETYAVRLLMTSMFDVEFSRGVVYPAP